MTKEAPILAVMVTKKHMDRVRDALLGEHEGWLGASDRTTPAPTPRKRPLEPTCRVVFTADTARMSQLYIILFIENNLTDVKDLHPIARQCISWGVSLPHEFRGSDMQVLGQEIYAELLKEGFDPVEDCLRAHTFPKELSSTLCRSLQQTAGGSCEDPYEGPINMTMSASKCTHVVSVIRHETGYAWNVENTDSHFAAKFNQRANGEILLEGTDSRTGKDKSSSIIPANIPVSRAYYKLSQVWDDILCQEITDLSGLGVDLGASPGGWTQVLKHIGLSKVVAIDPGLLADRVMSLPGVIHVAADMASSEAAEEIQAIQEPISLLVCDACILSVDILEKAIELLQLLDSKSWALPAAFVITLKMPFKSPASVNRNMEKVKNKIPSLLNKAASIMYKDPVKIRYQILHLMGNSDLERTLVAVFGEP